MTAIAFNEIITKNYEFLHPVAMSLTRNHEDARDLVQETLVRAISHMDKYQTGTNIKAWLYTIMRNIFINNYRKAKKFSKVNTDTPEDFFQFHTNKVAINGGFATLKYKEIKKKISDLPDIFRVAFEMYYVGYKYSEISESLNEPLGTIKSRIHFARKMLMAEIAR